MNNKNLTNPIYQRLFPQTYAKNLKIQEISLEMCEKLKQKMVNEMNNGSAVIEKSSYSKYL